MAWVNDIQGKGVVETFTGSAVSNILNRISLPLNKRIVPISIETIIQTDANTTGDTRVLKAVMNDGSSTFDYGIAQLGQSQLLNIRIAANGKDTLLAANSQDTTPTGWIMARMPLLDLGVPLAGSAIDIEIENGTAGDTMNNIIMRAITWLI